MKNEVSELFCSIKTIENMIELHCLNRNRLVLRRKKFADITEKRKPNRHEEPEYIRK